MPSLLSRLSTWTPAFPWVTPRFVGAVVVLALLYAASNFEHVLAVATFVLAAVLAGFLVTDWTIGPRTRDVTVYAVPAPVPIVTGPAHPRVLALKESSIVLSLAQPGTYRVALHYTPYMAARNACVRETADRMIELQVARAGVVRLAFGVTASRALAAIAGSHSSCPER